jgi:hypothetical protein
MLGSIELMLGFGNGNRVGIIELVGISTLSGVAWSLPTPSRSQTSPSDNRTGIDWVLPMPIPVSAMAASGDAVGRRWTG